MTSLKEYQEDRVTLEVYEACARRVAAEPRRGYLGMSQIGKPCERALWLDINGAERVPTPGRTARIFDCGHATEARVIADLRAAGFVIDGDQDGFEDFDGRFRGHRDGVIHGVTKQPHLLEIKSANDASFKNFKKNGLKSKPVYEAQMQCYMGYGGQERGLFVVENKNNQEIYTERVYFDRQKFDDLKAKAGRILAAAEAPDKITDETECRFCDFRLVCDQPLETATAQEPVGCRGCAHYRPKEKSAAASVDIVGVLRVSIETLETSLNLRLGQNIREAERLLGLVMLQRPDLPLPLDVWHGPSKVNAASRFTGILKHVLSLKNGYCLNAFLDTSDPMKTHYLGAAADHDWCAHSSHRAAIYTPMGCDDYDNGQVPF